MRHKIVSVSEAKAKLLELSRKVAGEGRAYILTRDGKPMGALIPMEDYEALIETSEIQADSSSSDSLKRALEDEARGRIWARGANGRWTRARIGRGVKPRAA